ncbi:MAG: hypothetical protein AAF639_23115 [Chloroflexota bacterium]
MANRQLSPVNTSEPENLTPILIMPQNLSIKDKPGEIDIIHVPMTYMGYGYEINSTLFALKFDETILTYDVDSRVTFTLPENFRGLASISSFDSSQLNFIIKSNSDVLIDDVIASIPFQVHCPAGSGQFIETNIDFSDEAFITFGTLDGQGINRLTNPPSRGITGTITIECQLPPFSGIDQDILADEIECPPEDPNRDTDNDGKRDCEDIDSDGDGIPDTTENDTKTQTGELIDTDGDGLPDYRDTDSDNDTIPDALEGHDLNADGLKDSAPYEQDSDNDGLDDAYDTYDKRQDDPTLHIKTENDRGSSASIQDFDGDTLPDWRDDDDDDDGLMSAIEWEYSRYQPVDLDLDAHPAWLDVDSDGDAIPDFEEASMGSTIPTDSDEDTIPDFLEHNIRDTDGRGWADVYDRDSDNDGILDSVEWLYDADGDRIPAAYDTDSDNDLIPDNLDTGSGDTGDKDGDMLPDLLEGTEDLDNDGIPNDEDLDADGDGIDDIDEGCHETDEGYIDYMLIGPDINKDGKILPSELDIDGDGVPNLVERCQDVDGDGYINSLDIDADNDGILDAVEGQEDVDNDYIINAQDTDADNDGIPDYLEWINDQDRGGIPNHLDETFADSDGDGIPDFIEGEEDSDGDGLANFEDDDTDSDAISDQIEGFGDVDGDGILNFQDADSDNDGISDLLEGKSDADKDGIINAQDTDSDNDGIPDWYEGPTEYTTSNAARSLNDFDRHYVENRLRRFEDADGDGIINLFDPDSDNDGLSDADEDVGILDPDGNDVLTSQEAYTQSLPSGDNQNYRRVETEHEANVRFQLSIDDLVMSSTGEAQFSLSVENTSHTPLEDTVVEVIIPSQTRFVQAISGWQANVQALVERGFNTPEELQLRDGHWELKNGQGPCPEYKQLPHRCLFEVGTLDVDEVGDLYFTLDVGSSMARNSNDLIILQAILKGVRPQEQVDIEIIKATVANVVGPTALPDMPEPDMTEPPASVETTTPPTTETEGTNAIPYETTINSSEWIESIFLPIIKH